MGTADQAYYDWLDDIGCSSIGECGGSLNCMKLTPEVVEAAGVGDAADNLDFSAHNFNGENYWANEVYIENGKVGVNLQLINGSDFATGNTNGWRANVGPVCS